VHILICPDKFTGSLSAVEVAAAIAGGWLAAAPGDAMTTKPLADGGPGFLDVVRAATPGHLVEVPTYDPLGRPVTGSVFVVDSGTAYLESAHACGLHLLAPDERDPMRATSYGLGPLVAAAVEAGARRIVVGLGGSATNDAGAGMLAALGAAPLDAAGYALPYGGAALVSCAGLGGVPRLRDAHLVAATDVDNPLTGPTGASAVFGPQKGASPEQVLLLDTALGKFAGVMERELPTCPPGLAQQPGGGAAGGLGAAILACGGRSESGIGLVIRLTSLEKAVADADLVVTGEGRFDDQSLRGKVVAGVARLATEHGVPCVVLAGQVATERDQAVAAGVTESHSLAEYVGSVEEAMHRPAEGLRDLAEHVARRWNSRRAV
jgi:glycerate kinase